MNDDSRIRVCQEEGETFLAPLKRAPNINSIKKWDSAFRIYTTIFTGASPERGTELLHYANIIHTAAANYPWENVAFYDFTFRHLWHQSYGGIGQRLTPRGGIWLLIAYLHLEITVMLHQPPQIAIAVRKIGPFSRRKRTGETSALWEK